MADKPRLLLVDDDTVTLQVLSKTLAPYARMRYLGQRAGVGLGLRLSETLSKDARTAASLIGQKRSGMANHGGRYG